MLELYEFALSGNCHKVRLMLGLLGLSYDSITINGSLREHKSPEFLSMNSFGQVPVLKDGNTVVRDSQAILVYLAHQYGDEQWCPKDAATMAHIMAWLATAANEMARGPNALRLHHKFGRDINLDDAQQITNTLLNIINERLGCHEWIATDTPSIADVALYPYIALAPEGKVDLSPYPSVLAWMQRMQALPGYVGMPGMQSFI